MPFANPPNFGNFLSPPTAPFMPEATDLGTALRAIQGTQQHLADERQRGVVNSQNQQRLAETARSNQANQKYNFGQLDLQRSIFQRKMDLDKEESAAANKKQVDALLAELDFAQRSRNTVRVEEVKEKLRRHGLTVEEIERVAPPAPPKAPAPFSGDPIPPGTKVDDLDAPTHTTAHPGGVIQNAPPPPKVDIDLDDPSALSPQERSVIGGEPGPVDPYGGMLEKAPLGRPEPSGRFRVKDAQGNVIHSTPEDQFGDSVRLVQSGLQPVIDGAPDYGKDAAQEAARYGAVLAESGLSPDEAMDKAISLYKWRLGEIEKTRRTELSQRPGGGGGGPAGPGMADIRLGIQQVNQHTNAVARDYKLNGINEALGDLNAAEDAIRKAEGGVGEIGGVTMVLKSLQGRISNYDMQQFIGSGGLLSQLNSLAGKTFGKGEIDPGYLQQVRLLIQQTRQVLQAKKAEAARVLQQRIDTDYAIDRVPELKGKYKRWGDVVTGGSGGGVPGGMSDEDLLNAAD